VFARLGGHPAVVEYTGNSPPSRRNAVAPGGALVFGPGQTSPRTASTSTSRRRIAGGGACPVPPRRRPKKVTFRRRRRQHGRPRRSRNATKFESFLFDGHPAAAERFRSSSRTVRRPTKVSSPDQAERRRPTRPKDGRAGRSDRRSSGGMGTEGCTARGIAVGTGGRRGSEVDSVRRPPERGTPFFRRLPRTWHRGGSVTKPRPSRVPSCCFGRTRSRGGTTNLDQRRRDAQRFAGSAPLSCHPPDTTYFPVTIGADRRWVLARPTGAEKALPGSTGPREKARRRRAARGNSASHGRRRGDRPFVPSSAAARRAFGEDGTVQGFLETAGVPLTPVSGVAGERPFAMDKEAGRKEVLLSYHEIADVAVDVPSIRGDVDVVRGKKTSGRGSRRPSVCRPSVNRMPRRGIELRPWTIVRPTATRSARAIARKPSAGAPTGARLVEAEDRPAPR